MPGSGPASANHRQLELSAYSTQQAASARGSAVALVTANFNNYRLLLPEYIRWSCDDICCSTILPVILTQQMYCYGLRLELASNNISAYNIYRWWPGYPW